MSLPTTKDRQTGVPISRITSGNANRLMCYYTAQALSHDGKLLACTSDEGGSIQAWVYDLTTGKGHPISNVSGGIAHESACFHPTKPWVFYASGKSVWRHDLEKGETETLYTTTAGFEIHLEIHPGLENLVFYMYEILDTGKDRRGKVPDNFHQMRNCRSYILSVHYETGRAHFVWGDTAPLTHPVISPVDENTVLFANQGIRDRKQELFTIHRMERDNRKPFQLYRGWKEMDERPIYMGHSFVTLDGWVGSQGVEFGGRQPDDSYLDMSGYNFLIKMDGTCDRRARCPGGNKPGHCHSAWSQSWWVGDSYPTEGANDVNALCIMKNNWETGYVQAEFLLSHGCTHKRPYHVHPRLTADEKTVLFQSNYGGFCRIYQAHVGEFLSKWKDKVPFTPRPARYCRIPLRKQPATPTPEGPQF